ncbi:TIGR00304 family protein [Candidatus Borrarchaeum sp.]|uniref:TIGR00304 family membrane protein n=1 Tax=Candidatus Borrarchaeum sp. TaxID=2846742 RepID=UPI0025811343|nr:TIGR00304 family protein [Candidatus Borrarchaeum sp.]
MQWNFLIPLGIILIIIGSIFIFLEVFWNIIKEKREEPEKDDEERRKKTKTKVGGGGVVLIGPIPIIFGSDKKFLIIAIVLAIILMIISFVLFYLPAYL